MIYTMAVTTDPALAAQAGGRMMALRNGLFLTPFGQLVFASPLKWVVDAGAAGDGVLHVVPRRQDERRHRADQLLGCSLR